MLLRQKVLRSSVALSDLIRVHPRHPRPKKSGSDPISVTQEADRTLGARIVAESMRDMAAGHRAVAGKVYGRDLLHACLNRFGDLARQRVGLDLYSVRSIV